MRNRAFYIIIIQGEKFNSKMKIGGEQPCSATGNIIDFIFHGGQIVARDQYPLFLPP